MKFNDLDLLNKKFLKKVQPKINKIFLENNFIFGKEVVKLEKKLSKYTSNRYCVTVGSGTDALLICLLSLKLNKEDEIIIPSFSWLSVIEVVLLSGAKAVFLETNKDTFNLDPNYLEKKINHKTKAIITTSLFGRTADLIKINKICKKNKIIHIEDAAQNFGSRIEGKNSCSIADMTCVSFFPSKNLGCFGDGGAIFTNSSKREKTFKLLRNHGQNSYANAKYIGLNSRIGTLQAGIILEKLKHINEQINLQIKIYSSYQKFFNKENIIGFPLVKKNDQNAYSHFNIIVKKRKIFEFYLDKFKIPYKIYYPKALYKQYGVKTIFRCSETEKICKNIISLPFNFISIKRHAKILSVLKKIINIDERIFEKK